MFRDMNRRLGCGAEMRLGAGVGLRRCMRSITRGCLVMLRRTDSPDDAADVLAETFLVAWRRLDDMPSGEVSHLWLYGVARRILADHHRGERRRTKLADRVRDELAARLPLPAPSGEGTPFAAAFRSLSNDDREAEPDQHFPFVARAARSPAVLLLPSRMPEEKSEPGVHRPIRMPVVRGSGSAGLSFGVGLGTTAGSHTAAGIRACSAAQANA